MVEFLQGRFRVDADYDNNFFVSVTDDNNNPVKGELLLAVDDNLNILGTYDEQRECFTFNIPANTLSGVHDYQFVMDGESLTFPDKIDFVRGEKWIKN